jgi:ribosomal protein S3
MNKTSNMSPISVFGAFARAGFFKKSLSAKSVSAGVVRPRYQEAATTAQAARLSEVIGRGGSSQPAVRGSQL